MDASVLEAWFARSGGEAADAARAAEMHAALLDALEAGTVRAAEPDGQGGWRVQAWVKAAILAGFRLGAVTEYEGPGYPFLDKRSYPPRALRVEDGVRLVPGGSAVRRGAHLGRGVVVMPPAYVNVGAFVGEGSMVDSHALVGTCAQVGARVHLSAGAQIGGVLEPSGARPVIVEDDAFVGALAGLFEGVLVRRRAVIAAGVVITASSTIFDVPNRRELRLEVPEGAVVVPGSRPASDPWARERGLSLASPVIVKYRDSRTDAATALESALRPF